MLRKIVISFSLAALLLWAAGCSKNPTNPTSEVTPVPTQEFGGYTATNEAPAFGDQDLVDAQGSEQEVSDPILASPTTQEIVNNVDAGMFHFRAVWGRIPYDSTVTTVTDWTGSLTISRGAIVLRRVIQFEESRDSILPRTDRTLLEWVSFTGPHHDGVAVDLFVPPAPPTYDSSWVPSDGDSVLVIDTIPAEPVTLTFATGPYTRTFTLTELASLDEVVALEDGNSVAFQSLRIFREVCPRGVLSGMWGYDVDGKGIFKGFWMSGSGHLTGYLEGGFGKDSLGVNVFFGKWIDASGQFEGFLRGTWGHKPPTANEESNGKGPGGWFAGGIFDANGNAIGILAGRFHSAKEYKKGWFQARWKLNCPNAEDTGNSFGSTEDAIGMNSCSGF